jgi:hypothetical protein
LGLASAAPSTIRRLPILFFAAAHGKCDWERTAEIYCLSGLNLRRRECPRFLRTFEAMMIRFALRNIEAGINIL